MSTKRNTKAAGDAPIYIAKLYAWLAANKIDIEYGPGDNGTDAETAIIERVTKQISAEMIDPTPELLAILAGLSAAEIGKK